jgi:hypothetical protein
MLRELGAAGSGQGENGFTFGLLFGIERARADATESALPRAWQKVAKAASARV